jgi:DNA-binding NarL/FixJ family response regulator
MRSAGLTEAEQIGASGIESRDELDDPKHPMATIAVSATDATVRERISAAISLSRHELLPTCQSPRDLFALTDIAYVDLVVLAPEPGPFTPALDLATVRAELPTVPVVLVGSRLIRSPRLIRSAINGVVFDGEIENALVPTIDAVLSQQLCVPSEMRDELARPVFSHRERQVLDLVARGMTNGEVAAWLYLSESTVKSHLASSFRKLGVSSRAEAVLKVLSREPGAGAPDPARAAHAIEAASLETSRQRGPLDGSEVRQCESRLGLEFAS